MAVRMLGNKSSILFPMLALWEGSSMEWTKTGFKNISNISARCKSHECSLGHINSMVSFNLLGKNTISTFLSQSYKDSIGKHNTKVQKNRKVLSIIIDSILFCGFQEISLRGSDEKRDSLNQGCFRSLLNFAGVLDKDVSDHLENSTVFKGNSATIQNEILECVLQVYKNKVIAQVSEAPFIAIVADETTDVSIQNQLSLVIRYIHNCKVVERFWGFFQPDSQC